jgi:hypothetical protein
VPPPGAQYLRLLRLLRLSPKEKRSKGFRRKREVVERLSPKEKKGQKAYAKRVRRGQGCAEKVREKRLKGLRRKSEREKVERFSPKEVKEGRGRYQLLKVVDLVGFRLDSSARLTLKDMRQMNLESRIFISELQFNYQYEYYIPCSVKNGECIYRINAMQINNFFCQSLKLLV